VFEDIGQFAGATSYIHTSFHLNLDDIARPIQLFKEHIQRAKTQMYEYDTSGYKVGGTKPEAVLMDLLQKHKDAHMYILDRASTVADELEVDFQRLKTLFPKPSTSSSLPKELQDKRERRFIGPIGTVLGTFLGIFNQAQIRSLERQIGDLYTRQQNLIDITSQHTLQIAEHSNLIADIALYLNIFTAQNPALTLQDTYLMERNITRSLEIARNTFQAAQYRRLSIDFLRADHLELVFQAIRTRADQAQATLIPERASDLFQLEMSYIFNGEQAIFILHVPTIPQGALLRLLRFHSFPLVYQDTAFMPKPQNDVIALSGGFDQLSLELNYADLMDCQHNNRFYVCEKHGILKRRYESTCLGALHNQNWELAITLCSMEVGHHEEAVLHLSGGKYLVYSPVDLTVPIKCGNHTDSKSNQAYVKNGIAEITVGPGCIAQLNDHQIIADSSIQLETDISHFAWNFSSLATEVTPSEIKAALKTTTNNLRFSKLTLADLLQNVQEQREQHSREEQEATARTFYIMIISALTLSVLAVAYLMAFTYYGVWLRSFIIAGIRPIQRLLGREADNHDEEANEPENIEA